MDNQKVKQKTDRQIDEFISEQLNSAVVMGRGYFSHKRGESDAFMGKNLKESRTSQKYLFI